MGGPDAPMEIEESVRPHRAARRRVIERGARPHPEGAAAVPLPVQDGVTIEALITRLPLGSAG